MPSAKCVSAFLSHSFFPESISDLKLHLPILVQHVSALFQTIGHLQCGLGELMFDRLLWGHRNFAETFISDQSCNFQIDTRRSIQTQSRPLEAPRCYICLWRIILVTPTAQLPCPEFLKTISNYFKRLIVELLSMNYINHLFAKIQTVVGWKRPGE